MSVPSRGLRGSDALRVVIYIYPMFVSQMFMIVVVYVSFVSIDTIDVNLLCLGVP